MTENYKVWKVCIFVVF